jgi:hypothetical protein
VRQLAGQGLSNRAIARIHGISEATVRRWTQPETITIPLDDDLRRDLATMASIGLSPVDAIRTALAFVADTYETAWALGAVPYGVQPEIIESVLKPPPAPPSATDDCHTPLPHAT